nr:protein kinase [Gemmatimonadales bacterium]
AQDLRHDRPVALKVLHPELAASLGPERFQREIRLAARLQHPHILTVHDSGEAAGQLWFTMPFVDGESLRDRLTRERQLPVEVALRITLDAARALSYAHEHGVIHRDIKPENLLLTTDGSTLVADFGIARALSGAGEQLTQTGMSVGTPAYMSPEQAAGERTLDARTDVYSLGTVLYEMLAGEPPFTGSTAQAVIAKRFSGEVPRVRQVRPSVPEPVEQAVTRALAPVAADRFASVAEFARALQTAGIAPATMPTELTPAVGSSGVRPPTSAGRPPRQVPAAATALVLGVLIGLGVLFAWRQSTSGGEDQRSGVTPLAVLPFENLGDSADAYFADGMTDAVRGKLSALPTLQITARQSSAEYKQSSKSVKQIGQELGVQYVLTGTVRWEKSGGLSRVQVSPELVQVATASTKWQQPFDAAMVDVFQVQGQVAGEVAEALNVALGAKEKQSLAEQPTTNLAAYQAYLKGEDLSSRDDLASLRRTAAYYEQAVALDSAFAVAWAQLSSIRSRIYVNGVPSPAVAEAARRAGERALALAPDSPYGHLALGLYYLAVERDQTRALQQYRVVHERAPNSVEGLAASARLAVTQGRWDEAVVHLRRAQVLNPRSKALGSTLVQTLLWLRRYPEALEASDRALGLERTNLAILEDRAMIYLAQGDLAGAQGVIRGAPKEIDPAALVAYLANYYDLFWVLDEAQQQLLLRLTPEPFDNNRAAWGICLAQTHALRGNQVQARAYADSSRMVFEAQLKESPDDAQLHVLLGLALAYLGRRDEAVAEGKRGVALMPVGKDAFDAPYFQHQLARIYILVGEPDNALDQLEPLLKLTYYLSPGWLRIDPAFDALRGNPRFERLLRAT